MSVEQTLLANLSGTTAFDSILKNGSKVDQLAAAYLKAVMFEPDASARTSAIQSLQLKVVDHFAKDLQPTARKLGVSNASDVLKSLAKGGATLDVNAPAFRQKVLLDLNLKTKDRLEIVKLAIDDRANTLDNRLAMFWKEPGSTDKAKLATLIHVHERMEEARRTYEKALILAGQGNGPKPRKPQLDFLSRFTEEAKQELRVQARRTASDTEHAVFEAQGASIFVWVTVNAMEACPDCRKRNGIAGTMAYFEQIGKPGGGSTVCGASCFCILVPAETMTVAPTLVHGLDTPKPKADSPTTAPKIEEAVAAAKPDPDVIHPPIDPHTDPVAQGWKNPPKWEERSYGGIVVNEEGQILLREPADHFGGYAFTWPKGKLDREDEAPHLAALREVQEETGQIAAVTGYLPGRWDGDTGSSYFYLMKSKGVMPEHDKETASARFVSVDEARALVAKSTNEDGRTRDLAILDQVERSLKKDTSLPDFPAAPSLTRTVEKLGGSTGATLVEDPFGQRFVKKTGNSPDHLREEGYAEAAYRAMGVEVPDSKVYEGGAPVKLAKFIQGRTFDKLPPGERAKAYEKAHAGFVADSILGNYDVVGLGYDNLLLGDDGKAWRIDVGGSLRFRAQGAKKTADQWTGYPIELWTLRDPVGQVAQLQGVPHNKQTAAVFSGVSILNVADQAKAIATKRADVLAALPADLQTIVGQRIDEAAHAGERTHTMHADKFKVEYLEEFTRHSMNLRRDVVTNLPKQLRQSNSQTTCYDENGKEWDDLRGSASHLSKVVAYIKKEGGNYNGVATAFGSQAGSSWRDEAQASKVFMASVRDLPDKAHYWKSSAPTARKHFKALAAANGGDEALKKAYAAYHAYTTEMLGAIDFQHNNRAGGTLRIMRTEDRSVMSSLGLKVGEKGLTMPRGAAESTSVFRRVSVHGSELTIQDVPHHRILGAYFNERNPGRGDDLLLGDNENEFVAHLEGIPFDYVDGSGPRVPGYTPPPLTYANPFPHTPTIASSGYGTKTPSGKPVAAAAPGPLGPQSSTVITAYYKTPFDPNFPLNTDAKKAANQKTYAQQYLDSQPGLNEAQKKGIADKFGLAYTGTAVGTPAATGGPQAPSGGGGGLSYDEVKNIKAGAVTSAKSAADKAALLFKVDFASLNDKQEKVLANKAAALIASGKLSEGWAARLKTAYNL